MATQPTMVRLSRDGVDIAAGSLRDRIRNQQADGNEGRVMHRLVRPCRNSCRDSPPIRLAL
ncbi:MAG TPA: hypothetical protein VF797_23245 [Noviherbaspirillum sp.]